MNCYCHMIESFLCATKSQHWEFSFWFYLYHIKFYCNIELISVVGLLVSAIWALYFDPEACNFKAETPISNRSMLFYIKDNGLWYFFLFLQPTWVQATRQPLNLKSWHRMFFSHFTLFYYLLVKGERNKLSKW